MHNWYNWLLLLTSVSAAWYFFARVRVYFRLSYRRTGADDCWDICTTALGGLINYHLQVPVVAVTKRHGMPWVETELETGQGETETHAGEEQRYAGEKLTDYWQHPEKLTRLVTDLKRYGAKYQAFMAEVAHTLRCESFRWCTRVASDDAAVTGVLAGALRAGQEAWLAALHRHLRFVRPPVVAVDADFCGCQCRTDFSCIFSVTLGNIINAGIALLRHHPSKGGTADGGTSHRGAHEDGDGEY